MRLQQTPGRLCPAVVRHRRTCTAASSHASSREHEEVLVDVGVRFTLQLQPRGWPWQIRLATSQLRVNTNTLQPTCLPLCLPHNS